MSEALEAFDGLMQSVEDLIGAHERIQTGRGRRHGQEALHRAGVVLTIAAWQSYVEKVSIEALNRIESIYSQPNENRNIPSWAVSAFYFRKPSVTKSVGDLNTPNSQNVIRLFDWSFGFNPKPFWIWDEPRRKWDPQFMCDRTDQWLRIRHNIAHGNALPNNLQWIKNNAGTPRLNLTLLKECKRHFTRLSKLTDSAFGQILREKYSLEVDW